MPFAPWMIGITQPHTEFGVLHNQRHFISFSLGWIDPE